jgi:hypothetical protein
VSWGVQNNVAAQKGLMADVLFPGLIIFVLL